MLHANCTLVALLQTTVAGYARWLFRFPLNFPKQSDNLNVWLFKPRRHFIHKRNDTAQWIDTEVLSDKIVLPHCWLSWLHPAGSIVSFLFRWLPKLTHFSLFVLPVSCVHVGDNELWAAAVFLAWEQRCNKPTGTGNQAAQAKQLPSCPLLPHDPLLVLRPQRETQLHWAGGKDQVKKGLMKWLSKK